MNYSHLRIIERSKLISNDAKRELILQLRLATTAFKMFTSHHGSSDMLGLGTLQK